MTRAQANRRKLLGRMGGQLQNILSTYFMDISRQNSVTGGYYEMYSNISINMGRQSIDTPDPTAVSHTPVTVSVTLHMETHIDLRNNDSVIVKVMDKTGGIATAFRGVVGNPWIVNSRKRVSLTMIQLGFDEIRDSVTPLP